MRQPDIEIYLKDADQDAVSAWLAQALGDCSPWQQKGQTFKCNAGGIPVTWLPRAVGKWHSLLLESDATPWEDDLSCALAAFAALGVEIRCAPGGWQEEEGEEDADRWIRVNAQGSSEIVWRTD
ncbi:MULTISPECIES: hypothetical protein [Pseudomonas]|uniref:hypothetical protein n=1 Tax=Pseudomonas TaxID=286 RepID=UPI0021E062FF|nr:MULTISPECIES: hypothetical protein [unclassified Pseudomonas]MCU9945962.1 hypothetical protein [Pseudomonas sp. PDM13]WCD79240.1 hypothetical protein PI990_25095 [Pseudomonas sp. TUM22785]